MDLVDDDEHVWFGQCKSVRHPRDKFQHEPVYLAAVVIRVVRTVLPLKIKFIFNSDTFERTVDAHDVTFYKSN